jgi:hypothetical protein
VEDWHGRGGHADHGGFADAPSVARTALANPVALVAFGAAGLAAVWVALILLALVVLLGGAGAMGAGTGCADTQTYALPSGAGVIVAATVYSGEGPGAYGAGLAGHYAFAELGLHSESDSDRAHADRIGVALGLGGPLAPFTQLEITAPTGRTVLAEKRDIGMGGPPIEGHQRAIDLWTSTREALGLPADWSGLVRVTLPRSGALAAEAPAGGAGCAAGAVPAGESARRIVAIARSQLGVGEQPPGSNCTVYGPCEPWCALFATWVWRHAGIAIPSLGFSGSIYDWAVSHAHVYPPQVRPQPGWAALFGTGPADPGTSLHVAIVESVLRDGAITLINGNFANVVMRTGPCEPASAALGAPQGCDEPGPIYAYAAPN